MLVIQSLARQSRLLALGAALLAAPAFAQVANPTVTGPIAQPVAPGDPSRQYIFFSSNHELPARGYVEEEYFISGTATRYATPNQTNPGPGSEGTVIAPSPQAYKTRMVIRRPADPAKFNGVVLVEWFNVTNNFDADNVWFFAWEHMMRAGYAWVGVSAQRVGVAALKAWSSRYSTLDVTVGNTVNDDSLSYDIFSQAGQALMSPRGVDMLGGLKPRQFIAIGESQSSQRLAAYSNSIQPLHNLYDGVLMLSPIGQRVRQDLTVPVFKVLTEWDVTGANEGNVRQDDRRVPNGFVRWEVAGTSHVDQHLRDSREPLELRDNGISSEATNLDPPPPNGCNVKPVGTRVPTTYVLASAFDKMVTWIDTGVAPPSAPLLELVPGTGSPRIAVRDALGIAQGGIRLAQVVAPTRINNGTNSGPGACVRWGYSTPIDQATLNTMYNNSFANFFNLAARTSKQNVMAGYILPQDLALDLADFSKVKIGP